ncbi:MAG: ion transporter [Defluviitaleaceae bacterium]|nr:ion transporter [Defluviitaleaceae bacterium]
MSIKQKVFNLIRDDGQRSPANRIFSTAISILIIVNIVMVIAELVFDIPEAYYSVFFIAEAVAVGAFTVEYLMRIWTANLLYPKVSTGAAVFKYVRSPMAIVDILAVLPFYLPFFPLNTTILRALRLLRLLRLVKLGRFTDAKTADVVFSSVKEAIFLADNERNFIGSNNAANILFPAAANTKKYSPLANIEGWPWELTEFDQNSPPIRFILGENYYQAAVTPVLDGEKLLRNILIITDITETVKLEMAELERVKTTVELINVMKNFGEGNFDVELQTYEGDWAWANDAFGSLRQNFKDAILEFESLAKYAGMGYFSMLANESGFKGNWADLARAMNDMVVSVEKPLADIEHNVMNMAMGNFTALPGNYEGRFESVINACNRTNDAIKAYVNEIAHVLGRVAKGDLDVVAEKEYIGEFAPVKTAINDLLAELKTRKEDSDEPRA